MRGVLRPQAAQDGDGLLDRRFVDVPPAGSGAPGRHRTRRTCDIVERRRPDALQVRRAPNSGLIIELRSSDPSAAPAPTSVWSSSMNRMMSRPARLTSSRIFLTRPSNSPRYFVPATSGPSESASTRLSRSACGTLPCAMRCASPSTIAVLPTPGSPISTDCSCCAARGSHDAFDFVVARRSPDRVRPCARPRSGRASTVRASRNRPKTRVRGSCPATGWPGATVHFRIAAAGCRYRTRSRPRRRAPPRPPRRRARSAAPGGGV